ncbi:protoporphyrinogen oxidase [Granulicoccus phenolivorans]|uniref:protoporphyrinogen oxidase n=1 Tax=Granulicoccus phenolivorans TaxID=266854 RepID=UPI00041184F2|nr:protoporphyrinogen oxidase [Granulicoccus phenolivorans]
MSKQIVVVGGGLAGLTSAYRLTAAGHRVSVLEATDRVGGQIRTVDFAGLPVDVGAEAMHLAAPALRALVQDVGRLDSVVGARPGSSYLVGPHGLRPLPAGVGPTGPTRLRPVLVSGLLGPRALARAGLEPVLARRRLGAGDVSVGSFIRGRFGDAVADTFVDPLLGNLHSGDIDRLSLRATAPQLVAKAQAGQSLIGGARAAGAAGGAGSSGPAVPAFASWPAGLRTLPDALAGSLDISLNQPVLELRRAGSGWAVRTATGTRSADEVVLAVPAAVAADLLAPLWPEVATDLRVGRTASVATVVLGYAPAAARSRVFAGGNGVLLNSGRAGLMKAATFLSTKWAHLADASCYVVRASVGRVGQDRFSGLSDAELTAAVHTELAALTGWAEPPVQTLVQRWPSTVPQLEVGHLDRIGRVRVALAGSGLHLAGAAYDGLGLASVVKSAEQAATDAADRRTP